MSCGNFNIMKYPKLSKLIQKDYGYDIIKLNTMLSLAYHYAFKTNPEENPEEALKLLKEYKVKDNAEINDFFRKFNDDNSANFANNKIKDDAVTYVEKLFLEAYYNLYIKGITPTFERIMQRVGVGVLLLKSRNRNNLNQQVKDNIDVLERNIGIVHFTKSTKDSKPRFESMDVGNPRFIGEIIQRKEIHDMFNKKEIEKYFAEENHIVDESEIDRTIEDSELDNDDFEGNSLFSVSIGQKRSYKDHIRGIIKFHIKLMEQRIEPSSNSGVKTGESFNEPLYMDEDYIELLLASKLIDKSSEENFINSLYEIINENERNYGLIKLYNTLKNNKNILRNYYSTFDKEVMPRIAVHVGGYKIITRQQNININPSSKIANYVFDGMQSAATKTNIYLKFNADETNPISFSANDEDMWFQLIKWVRLNKAIFDKTTSSKNLYILFNAIVNNISYKQFVNAYTNSKLGTFDANAAFNDIIGNPQSSISEAKSLLSGVMSLSVSNKVVNKTLENISEENKEELESIFSDYQESVFGREVSNTVYNISNRFSRSMIDGTALNSSNIENENVSDLINKNYMIRIADKLHTPVTEKDSEETTSKVSEDYFRDRKLQDSNFLLEHRDENGNIINYGIFRKIQNSYEFTEYRNRIGTVALLDGVKAFSKNIGSPYSSMTDNDYLLTAFGLFLKHYNPSEEALLDGNRIANFLAPIPSDAQHNFVISNVVYKTTDLFQKDENDKYKKDKKGNYIVNRNSVIYKQFLNIANKELVAMNTAINAIFMVDYDKNGIGTIRKENGKPVYYNGKTELTEDEKRRFYDKYHLGKWKETVEIEEEVGNRSNDFYKKYAGVKQNNKKSTKEIVHNDIIHNGKLLGNVFKFLRIRGALTNEANAMFDKLSNSIDFLTGDNEKLSQNGTVVLTTKNDNLLHDAIDKFLSEFFAKNLKYYKETFANVIYLNGDNQKIRFDNSQLRAFMFNDYLTRDSMFDFLGGDIAFYKNPQEILKRIKEIQGSGDSYAIGSLTSHDNSEEEINITVNNETKPIVIRGKTLTLKNTFNAVTIANTVKSSDNVTAIKEQAKKAKLSDKEIKEILAPYIKDDAMNDAQSYITWEEWIRRMAAIGEIDKYASLIDKINDIINTEDKEQRKEKLRKINWNDFPNRVQVLKNFYYDLYYDDVVGTHVARQVKNAEFVLIPCLIEGTDLEDLYNSMIANDIDQVNTAETTKVAIHNVITYWDNEGNPVGAEEFRNNAGLYKEQFNYKYLYRQQIVPQHMVDTVNKLGVQLYKKIQDNFNGIVGKKSIEKLTKNIVENIKQSAIELYNELNIKTDKDGNIILDEDGNIPNFNYQALFERFKENAIRSGVSKNILQFFDVDDLGIPKYPLYMTNISNKVENIINGLINSNITRNTLAGFHCAQVSDFGFNMRGTKQNLNYKTVGTIKRGKEEITVYEIEVYATRWSKSLEGFNLKDVPEDLRTFIGYRIPTEGKQSIAIMKVVPFPASEDGFLPDFYGSTLVMPHDWLKQTGSDYDVDSVYTIVKRLFKTKNINGKTILKGYDADRYIIQETDSERQKKEKYISYLIDNRNKFISKKLGSTDFSREEFENYKEYKKYITKQYAEELEDIQNGDKENHSYFSYKEFLELSKEDLTSFDTRNNEIVEAMIELYSNPETFAESLLTSNFEDINDSIKKYDKLLKEKSYYETAINDFVTQSVQFKDATSAIKLKGVYVNLSSLNSISNVVKGVLPKSVSVRYTPDIITFEDAKKRFGENNVREVKAKGYFDNEEKTYIEIDHNKIGWSLDNKNVKNKIITYYHSQLVAHILDVMKSGSTKNENLFTVYLYSLLPSIGVDYDTAIGLLYQPATDVVVKKWAEQQSVLIDDNNNVITEALAEYVAKLNKNFNRKKYYSKRSLLKQLNDLFTKNGVNLFERKFGFKLTDENNIISNNLRLNAKDFEGRLSSKDDSIDSMMFDVYVILNLNNLNDLGKKLNTLYNALRTDGYGAKKSFFENYEVLDNIEDEIYSDNPSIKTEDGTNFLTAVFGELNINDPNSVDLKNSKYPIIAAYLKYSTMFSAVLGKNIMYTTTPNFIRDIKSMKEFMGREITDEEFGIISKYVISKYIVGNYGSPYLILPVVVDKNGEIVFNAEDIKSDNTDSEEIIANNYAELREQEQKRVIGIGINRKFDFKVEDFGNPTDEELIAFSKLTPAQKIVYLRDEIKIGGLVDNLSTSFVRYKKNKDNNVADYSKYYHRIYINNNNISTDGLSDMFNDMLFSSNPLIRAAAVDLVKYAYIYENNYFGYTSVNKIIGVNGIREASSGGLDIVTAIEFAMQNLFITRYKNEESETSKKQSLLDKISYVRTHYNTFPCKVKDFTKFKDGVKFEKSSKFGYIRATPVYSYKTLENNVEFFDTEWNRKAVEKDTTNLYIFTDNTNRSSGDGYISDDSWYAKKYGKGKFYPKSTQAVIRGLDNARPISTQKYYVKGEDYRKNRWTDDDIEEFRKVITDEFNEIRKEWNTGKYNHIIFSNKDGLFNSKISDISETRTPKLFEFLLNEYDKFIEEINSVPKDHSKEKQIRYINDDSFVQLKSKFGKILKDSNTNTLYFVSPLNEYENDVIYLLPLNRLESFEVDKNIENSINPANNEFASLGEQINAIYNNVKDNQKLEQFFIPVGEDKNNVEESLLPVVLQGDLDIQTKKFIPIDTRVVNLKDNTLYYYKDSDGNIQQYYAVSATKFKSQPLSKKYAISPEDVVVLIHTNAFNEAKQNVENDLVAYSFKNKQEVENEENDYTEEEEEYATQYSRFSNNDIENFAVEAINRVYRDSVRNNYTATQALRIAKSAGIDIRSFDSIKENLSEVVKMSIEIISHEIDNVLNDINKFVVTGLDAEGNNIYSSISDDEVTNKVIKDEELRERFLTVINTANSIRRKWEDIFNIPVETLPEELKPIIEDIKDRIEKVTLNHDVIKAMQDFWNKYLIAYSKNPNVGLGLVNAYTHWGDTSTLDKIFQDVASNKDPVVQLVTKEIYSVVEQGRLEGIDEFHKFEDKLKEISAKAARNGRVANINSLLGDDGKLISAANKQYKEDRDKLEKAILLAKNLNTENSIEYWKAVHNLNKFKAVYEINRTKPATVTLHILNQDITVEGSLDMLKVALDDIFYSSNNNDIITAFVTFKYLKNKIYQINKNSISELTTEQQEELDEAQNELNAMLNEQVADSEDYYITGEEESEEKHYTEIAQALRDYNSSMRLINDLFGEKVQKNTFESELKHNLEILNRYRMYDNNQNEITNVEYLFDNVPEFKRAYEWIRKNAILTYEPNTRLKINEAYEALRDIRAKDSESRNQNKTFNKYRNIYTDIYGQFDGKKFSKDHKDDVAKIKQEQLSRYRKFDSAGNPFGGFIRVNTEDPVVYTEEYYMGINPNYGKHNTDPDYQKYVNAVSAINTILMKHYNYYSKRFNVKSFTIEELQDIARLFNIINNFIQPVSTSDSEFIKANCNFIIDSAYKEDSNTVEREMSTEYADAWKQAFSVLKDKVWVARSQIYGRIEPKEEVKEKYIDKQKTNAVKTLNKYTREVPTKYYYEVRKQMKQKSKEEYDKWYDDNHYYDPYSGRMKPIRIWTYTQYLNDLGEASTSYEARNNQLDFVIKDEYINEEYSKVGVAKFNPNNKGTKNYTNPEYSKLNEEQRELMEYLRNTMKKYAFTIADKKFIEKGYLPSAPTDEPLTIKEFGIQTLKSFGWWTNSVANEDQGVLEDTTFENDYDINNRLYKDLGDYQSETYIPLLPKQETESNEDYKKRIEEAIAKNDEIKKNKEKFHADLLNKNWEQVFKYLITNGEIYNAKRKIKPFYFAAMDFIKDTDATRVTDGKVRYNHGRTKPQTVNQRNTITQLQNMGQKLFYEKYKDSAPKILQKMGSLFQNISGTKYMAMNIQGGIANVITGADNIMMERLAGEYVDFKTWEKAKLIWMQNVPRFVAGMYNDEGVGFVDALIKYCAVVDYDRFAEVETSQGFRLGFKRFRNLLFSPQNAGEHFMQNTMLIAMMMTHKLVQQEDGTYKVMTKREFRENYETKALLDIIRNDEKLFNLYKTYQKQAKEDKQVNFEYTTYRDDMNNRFVRRHLNIEQKKQYNARKKELSKELDNKFESINETIYNQFEYTNGRLKFKDDAVITKKQFSEFIYKVRQVNNKIHGVYNKQGAALLERHWFGGTVMQYHKHLYPGFKKRFRWNGYFNETLGTVEKGCYVSFFQFITTPFREKLSKEYNDDIRTYLEAYKNMATEVWNFYRYIRTNFRNLPDYEKDNIARMLPDLIWSASSIVLSMALYGFATKIDWDEDDILYNLLVYELDRMNTEASAYHYGVINEFEVLWSSPVAILQTLTDVIKTMGMGAQFLLNSDYSPYFQSGKFAHEHKLAVYLQRNIPVYRTYYNFKNLPKNNKFYKLNKNLLGLIPYKDITLDILDFLDLE